MASKNHYTKNRGILHGYRSGLEDRVAGELDAAGIPYRYEQDVIRYMKPAKEARYTPDFVLTNGIVCETKGRYLSADRQKHLLVKAQFPDIDIRIVFSRSATKISKQSKTTYAMWCEKHGFKYADGSIPEEWLWEPVNQKSLDTLTAASKKR